MASPLFVERRGEMARLLNQVDKLSDRLHSEFPTITEEDYRQFGPELKIVIRTLKDLRKESLTHRELKPYDNRMREQIIDLEELDHDIRTFRVEAPKNEALQQTMAAVGSIDFSYLFKQDMIRFVSITTFRTALEALLKVKRGVYAGVPAEICRAFKNTTIEQIRANRDMILMGNDSITIKLRLPDKNQRLSKADGYRLIYMVMKKVPVVAFLMVYP